VITTESTPPPLKTYIRVGWELDKKLNKGSSIYPAVNLRKKGLKSVKCKALKRSLKYVEKSENYWLEIIDLRFETFDKINNKITFEWWDNYFEVIDKKKFFLSRIEYGF